MRYLLLKWIVIFISSVFLVGGSLGLGAALWSLWSRSNAFQQLVESSSPGLYVLIGSVALLALSGVLGVLAVLRQSQPVLGSFAVLSIVTLILSLLGGVWTFVTASRAEEMSLKRVAHIVLHDYGIDATKTAVLDIIQQTFQCCGSYGFSSWSSSAYNRLNESRQDQHHFSVPQSCCVDPFSPACQQHRIISSSQHDHPQIGRPAFIYTKGCVTELEATSVPYGSYVLCFSLTSGVVQVAGIAGSILLFRTFRYLDNSVP